MNEPGNHDQHDAQRDREFAEYLQRRRPLFRREVDDDLEPPEELDRIVLRQAREAIEMDRPVRHFGMPRWAAPMAIAATLVLGIAVVIRPGPAPDNRVPEVRVENIAQRVDYPPPPAPPPPPPAPVVMEEMVAADAPVVVQLQPSPAAIQPAAARPTTIEPETAQPAAAAPPPPRPALAAAPPAWRQDPKAWMAEIDRLRASGQGALADAELAEFNRQHRAMAVAPDR